MKFLTICIALSDCAHSLNAASLSIYTVLVHHFIYIYLFHVLCHNKSLHIIHTDFATASSSINCFQFRITTNFMTTRGRGLNSLIGR